MTPSEPEIDLKVYPSKHVQVEFVVVVAISKSPEEHGEKQERHGGSAPIQRHSVEWTGNGAPPTFHHAADDKDAQQFPNLEHVQS